MKHQKKMNWVFVILAVVLQSSAFARADVSLRNGNFFTTFKYISYTGGFEPKVETTYNSISDFLGYFGYGWGTVFSTYIKQDADGSLIVSEHGAGSDNRFTQKNQTEKDIQDGISKVVEVAKKNGIVNTAAQVAEYQKKLQENFEFRSEQFGLFVKKGFLPKREIKEGAQFISTKFLYQYITKVKGGYIRVMDGGELQKFDEAGRLVQIQDKNKNYVTLNYDKIGRLESLVDNLNRKMLFTVNDFGRVTQIVGVSGKKAEFRYSKDGILLEYAKDENGVETEFKYVEDRFRNLKEMIYLKDKDLNGKPKTMQISYYPPDQSNKVKSVKNPDGTYNEYEYSSDPKKGNHQAVRVILKDSKGKLISDSKYEYFMKIRTGGELYSYKMISDEDGFVTETEYDEKLGYPVKVKSGDRVTTMAYDAKGRITKRESSVDTTTYQYDEKSGGVKRLDRALKSGLKLWYEYVYDSIGNLIEAKNHEKRSLKIVRDPAGKIRALSDQTGRQLLLKYNELGKAAEITDPKKGTLKVIYKNSGEVDRIDTGGKEDLSSDILETLGTWSEITNPIGVSLGV